MGRHCEQAGVQEQGWTALANLGVNAENKVKIEKVGGIKAIMKGMGRHGEDAGVQQEGCAAL